jgi:hypothetical protein
MPRLPDDPERASGRVRVVPYGQRLTGRFAAEIDRPAQMRREKIT